MPTGTPGRPIDYTLMENHEKRSDPRDDPDPSNPEGDFWHRNERPGAESIKTVDLRPSRGKAPAGDEEATGGPGGTDD